MKNGLGEKALLSAINLYEFKYREADFGKRPKGLVYGLQILDSWLYDENKPFIHIEANETFAKLREKATKGYFEGLVEKYLLDNSHGAMVILQPKTGLAATQEKALKEKLSDIQKQMTQEQLAQVQNMMEALTAFRETEDRPEDIAKIPLLTRSDMRREALPLNNKEKVLAFFIRMW